MKSYHKSIGFGNHRFYHIGNYGNPRLLQGSNDHFFHSNYSLPANNSIDLKIASEFRAYKERDLENITLPAMADPNSHFENLTDNAELLRKSPGFKVYEVFYKSDNCQGIPATVILVALDLEQRKNSYKFA